MTSKAKRQNIRRLCLVLATQLMMGSAWAKPTSITFIHFNDLHAHLVPHWDKVRAGQGTEIVMRGGLARTATLIQQIRNSNPNSILMNIGDTYHGGVEALFTNGNAIVDPVNALGVDVGVPGNWDFAYGPIVTRLRYAELNGVETGLLSLVQDSMAPTGEIKRPNFPNLAANVTYTMPFWKAGKSFLPPAMIKEVGGIKIGFIGITSDIVPRMHKALALGLSFLDGEDNYRALIEQHAKALRAEGVQIVVVMSELGLQKNYQLAQVVAPGLVDVLFSAHTHEAVFVPLKSKSGALVVEAGNDGYVGRMDVAVENGKVVSRRWKLLAVDQSLQENPEMKALVEKARAPFLVEHPNLTLPSIVQGQTLDKPISSVLGYVDGALDRRNVLDSTFNSAFAEALRNAGGTQTALTPGFRFDSIIAEPGVPLEDNTVAKGAITLEDAYRFFPVSYTIGTASITGAGMRTIMEQNLDDVFAPEVFRQSGGWADGWAGLQLTVDLTRNKGERIQSLVWKDSGNAVTSAEKITVTGCIRPMDETGVLCSYSGFESVLPIKNPSTGKPWTVIDLLANMLEKGQLKPVKKQVTDLSQTALWPAAPYVQPLSGIRHKQK